MTERDDIVRATHGSSDHPLQIGDFKIACYVLEDGRRVLYQRAMVSSLGMARGGSSEGRGDRLAKFVAQDILRPYVSEDLIAVTADPMRFRTPRGNVAYGYEATVLADICEAVLKARDNEKLQGQQKHIADRCEQLIRAFARVGIIALVDEATGYQVDRDRDELQRILSAYISPELLPWVKRFPDEFYAQLFRLRGWQYRPLSVKKPRIVGKLTNQLVYEKLPNGVLDELRRKNPVTETGRRKHRHHQLLTENVGNPHLGNHLAVVTALMRISPNWRAFERNFIRNFPPPAHQLSLLPEDDNEDD